jgi:methionyl-tRNA formyltransferase
LAGIGAELMAHALRALEAGPLQFVPQSEAGITYAKKVEKSETRIDWTRPAAEVHNQIRALSPFPGAWFEMPNSGSGGERVKILRATHAAGSGAPGTILSLDPIAIACADGAVAPTELQRAGRKPTDAAAFVRGARLEVGAILR